jgi:hypothetical protein
MIEKLFSSPSYMLLSGVIESDCNSTKFKSTFIAYVPLHHKPVYIRKAASAGVAYVVVAAHDARLLLFLLHMY